MYIIPKKIGKSGLIIYKKFYIFELMKKVLPCSINTKFYTAFVLSFTLWPLSAKSFTTVEKQLLYRSCLSFEAFSGDSRFRGNDCHTKNTIDITQQHFVAVNDSFLANKYATKSSKNSSDEFSVEEQLTESSMRSSNEFPASGHLKESSEYDSIDNSKKEIVGDLSNAVISDHSSPLTNKAKAKPSDEIQVLNQFFTNNSSLTIHNKALELLKNKNKIPAIILLKKNFYQNLFPPSYFLLNQLEESISFSPVFLLAGFIIISLVTVIFFILYLQTFSSVYLKNLLGGLFIFSILLAGNLLLLKDRVSPLTEIYLKLAPAESAPNTVQLSSLEELVVLKKQGKWLKIKDQKRQTGWILKQQVFQLF